MSDPAALNPTSRESADSDRAPARSPFVVEQKPAYRADTDQNGDWYVWRRLGPNGWATLRRCDDREAAVRLADSLNASGRIAV